jgi:hypothetical protein
MRPQQVDAYLLLLTRILKGELYSWNMDAQPFNKEGVNVTEQLKRYFNIRELGWHGVSRSWKSRLPDISPRKVWRRVTGQTPPYVVVREYICVKK